MVNMIIEPSKNKVNRYERGPNKLKIFKYLVNCTLCNSYCLTRKFLYTFLCEDCNVLVSSKNGKGIERLELAIASLVNKDK